MVSLPAVTAPFSVAVVSPIFVASFVITVGGVTEDCVVKVAVADQSELWVLSHTA